MFFTQIYQMMNQSVDITLVIRKKEGQLMVSAMPKSNGLKDEAQNHIVPLTLTGTPQEMDMGFMQAICQPIQKVTGLLTNMNRFEEQADKAAANSKAAKEQKDKIAKEAREKKEKFDKLMKKAVELETEQKYADALATLKQAKVFASTETIKGVDEKTHALRMKMSQGSLFGMEETPQPPQQAEQIPQVQVVHPNGQSSATAAQQPGEQPMNGTVHTTTGQPVGQPVYGNGQNGGQFYAGGQGSLQNTHNPPYTPQHVTEIIPQPEPELAMTADYSAHREGEYDGYPDFPGYSNNNMYNPQNI